jgi:hypothetical protein
MNVDRAQLAKRSGIVAAGRSTNSRCDTCREASHDTAPTLRRLLFSYDRSARETSVRAPSMSVPSSAFSAGLLRRSLHAAGDVHRSLTAVERAHVVEAFTFELGKVYEKSIKERELQVLANIDADIKLVVLLHEAYRHCKPLGAWGDGVSLLDAAGMNAAPRGSARRRRSGQGVHHRPGAALGLHRVWERANAVMASAVHPSKASSPTPKERSSTRRAKSTSSRR